MPRADLLALTDDSLAALANRGIVKRATREVAEGAGPTLLEAADGTLTGTFADGTAVVVGPSATLDEASCTCTATGVCRHRVMVALAHREQRAAAAWEDWSPGEFTDEELEARVGARVLGQARKAFRAGYRARVSPPSDRDPVPTVELSSCTVRFLAPHALGYARVDAAKGAREDAVALAVWAFRAAPTTGEPADVAVGGAGSLAASAGGSGIEPVLPLLAELLADGATHVGPAIGPAILQSRRVLERRNLRWPVDALDDLASQLDAYRDRSARYRPEAVAALLAEIVARHRCVVGGGAPLRPAVLGTEEAAETPLRLLRLVGLGARVVGDDDSRRVEVYLGHAEAGIVLAIRRDVEVAEDEVPPPGEVLGRRRAGGARLNALAAGNVVTESASRSASRLVRIVESRIARTTASASTGAWDELPAGIFVDDLDAEAARLASRPAAVLRPRVVAESLRAIAVEEVSDVWWQPGEQVLTASITAPVGSAQLRLAHSSAVPGAIDALSTALDGSRGPVRFVAGHVSRHRGSLVVEPTAVVAGTTVVVPAFAAATGEVVDPGAEVVVDPLSAAVGEALSVSAEVAHRGWRDLSAGWRTRAGRSARELRRVGLPAAGDAVDSLTKLAATVAADAALDRWADTHLRLLVTAEQL